MELIALALGIVGLYLERRNHYLAKENKQLKKDLEFAYNMQKIVIVEAQRNIAMTNALLLNPMLKRCDQPEARQ